MIEAALVSKSFGDIKAVNGISVTIKEGSVFGLVGTNGARYERKTTCII